MVTAIGIGHLPVLRTGRTLHCRLPDAATLVSRSRHTGERHHSPRTILKGTLLWGKDSLLVPFMIDLAVDDSFIDATLAKQA